MFEEDESLVPEQDAWDQLPGEPTRWFALFTEYRLLGPRRTLTHVYRTMQKEAKELGVKVSETEKNSTFSRNAVKWHWKERAEQWDVSVRMAQEAHAEEVLGEGIALVHNRVSKLKLIAEKLEDQILNPSTKRISPYIIEQYRGILNDIALEKGERKEKKQNGLEGKTILITEWGRGGSASDAWEKKSLPQNAESIHILEGQLVTDEHVQ